VIQRNIADAISKKLFKKKALLITGARQVGKTTLVRYLSDNLALPFNYLNCDEPDVRMALSNPSSTQLKQLIGTKKMIIIDEAQRIQNIGVTSKLFVDSFPDVQLILTGSSSLDMLSELSEPLTGRKFEFTMHPFSFSELMAHFGAMEENRMLDSRMIYGYYPEIVLNPGDEADRLLELTNSYLFKDILALGTLKKPVVLDTLTQALALQIGNEVSLNELSQTLAVDKNTIIRYIDLLEKSFVIFSLHSWSRNLRNELKKSRKIYFWDMGVRNAIIKNFNPLDLRNDKGAIWENFIIAERIKFLNSKNKKVNSYFWRTAQQQEIDYIEDYGGNLYSYEIKYNPAVRVKQPITFNKAYPTAEFKVINRSNYQDFIV